MLKIENDRDCLNLLQKGNTKALEYLIKIYFPLLCDYAEKILENRAEAEDITEELFIKLWERRLSFDTFNELKSYLYTSVRNASLNKLRSRKREELRHREFVEGTLDNSETSSFVYEEAMAEIRKSIYLLPPKMREIFILSYYKKMKNEEIAAHLNLSHQTVRNQKTKALSLLKDLLKDKNFFLLYWIYISVK